MVVEITFCKKRIALPRHRRRKTTAQTILITLLLLATPLLANNLTCQARQNPTEQTGRNIDLYTNKTPNNGKGPNQTSDAYEPQEQVILYALVTYNGDPVAGKIVTFAVKGPPNTIEIIEISQSNTTDANGLTQITFSIPWPDGKPQATLFGTWTAVASVDIVGVITTDTITFNVGWIIELVYITTTDPNNTLKNTFGKGENIAFRLGVRSIAMTQKTATLTITAKDELNVAIGTITLENEAIPPGEREYFIKQMTIPATAFTGQARAVANAYKTPPSLPVPWCPSVETTFQIGILHDIAVLQVTPTTTEAFTGQSINITVTVKNKGQAVESFDTETYYNNTLIGTTTVNNLSPNDQQTLNFIWITWNVTPGNYTLSAKAGPVLGETNLNDNTLIDNTVQIKPIPTPPPPPPKIDQRWLLALLLILIVFILALLIALILLLLARRRRKGEEDKPKPDTRTIPVLPLSNVKKCKVCGKEFPAVYTFCPHCTSFHGKDYE
jgi:hypothetical protein